MPLIVTKRDVDIARLRQRTAYAERRKIAAAVVRRPCLGDMHEWNPHPADAVFDRCELCRFVRIHELRNKPKKAIRLCTEMLNERDLLPEHYRTVELLVAPYLNLRHYIGEISRCGYLNIQTLVRLDLCGIRQWVPCGVFGPTNWPDAMRVARKYVKEPPVVLFKQLRGECYGEPAAWPSYLGDEPGLDCGIGIPDEPAEPVLEMTDDT